MSTSFNLKYQNAQKHKVDRLINTYGEELTFKRLGTNEFGEPVLENPVEYTLQGVYHEEHHQAHLGDNSTNSSTTRQRVLPMVLCRASGIRPVVGDLLEYHSKQFRITEVKDVLERGFAVDISLEEVQSDGHEFQP